MTEPEATAMGLARHQAAAEAIYDDFASNSGGASDLDTELAAYVSSGLGLDLKPGTEEWHDLESLIRDKIRNAILNIVIDIAPEDDEPECFDGSLNIDAGSPMPEFPPFLRSQLDRLHSRGHQ